MEKYCIAIVHKFDEVINGECHEDDFYNNNDYYNVKNGYMYYCGVSTSEFFNKNIIKRWHNFLKSHSKNENNFPTIEIVKRKNINVKETVIERYYSVCLIKTHYLRILQRKWKRLFKKMIFNKMNPNNLQIRQLTGQWPECCRKVLY